MAQYTYSSSYSDNDWIAGFLALFLVAFGIDKLYLGETFEGFVFLTITLSMILGGMFVTSVLYLALIVPVFHSLARAIIHFSFGVSGFFKNY